MTDRTAYGRRVAALLVSTLAGCGPAEIGETYVFEDNGATFRVTVERVADCDALRDEAEQLENDPYRTPRAVSASVDPQVEGECVWATGTLTNTLGTDYTMSRLVVMGAHDIGRHYDKE